MQKSSFIVGTKLSWFFDMKPLVLYAEDDSNDALLCEHAFELSNLPIDLRIVDDGAHLISWLRGEGDYADRAKFPLPRLVITDSKMPLKGGLDVLRCVRTYPELHDIPVVLYYGSIFFQDLGVFGELGVNACIEKDFHCRELVQTVGDLLGMRPTLWRPTTAEGLGTSPRMSAGAGTR